MPDRQIIIDKQIGRLLNFFISEICMISILITLIHFKNKHCDAVLQLHQLSFELGVHIPSMNYHDFKLLRVFFYNHNHYEMVEWKVQVSTAGLLGRGLVRWCVVYMVALLMQSCVTKKILTTVGQEQ